MKSDSQPAIFEKRIYDYVEKQPEFPGGNQELLKFCSQNLWIPKGCDEMEGHIIITLIIDETGYPTLEKIRKIPSPKFIPVIEEIVSKMPCWSPGELGGGIPVMVRYSIPISIRWE